MSFSAVKDFLKKFILTRWLYLAYRYVKESKIRKIRKNIQSKGPETIFYLEKVLSSSTFFYMDMGTMLGIVREGRLLGHDLDIDVAVYAETEEEKERIKTLLLDAGCKLKYAYCVKELGTVELSFVYNDLKFDISFYTREDGRDVCYLMYNDPDLVYENGDMSVVKLSIDPVLRVKKVPFLGGEVTIPEEPEKYLAQRYGENWRTPDRGYVYWKGPTCQATDYSGYRVIGS